MDQNLQGKTEIAQQRRRGILPRSPLVPKLNLGTHLPAKLYFAVRRHGRSILLVALLTLLFPGSVRIALAEEPNTLTPAEKNNGWQLLFDGQTTKGWRGYKSTTMPASWKAENGSLLSRHEQGDTTGDIITVDEYGDFELTLEWKMTKGGNSGVMYRATEEAENVWESGSEYQILDNAGHMDGLNPLASAGSCYAVFAPAKDMTKPLGQWNQTRIVAHGKHVEHWMNGEKLLEYDVDTELWRAHVKTSRYYLTAYGKGSWGLSPKGHIALQDYGGAIEFRNIKVRPGH